MNNWQALKEENQTIVKWTTKAAKGLALMAGVILFVLLWLTVGY